MQVPAPLIVSPVQELLFPRPVQQGAAFVEFTHVARHLAQRTADGYQRRPWSVPARGGRPIGESRVARFIPLSYSALSAGGAS